MVASQDIVECETKCACGAVKILPYTTTKCSRRNHRDQMWSEWGYMNETKYGQDAIMGVRPNVDKIQLHLDLVIIISFIRIIVENLHYKNTFSYSPFLLLLSVSA